MKKTAILLLAAVLCLIYALGASASNKFVPTDPIMPLSQVKVGMTGHARTVLSGTQISSFKVTVIGILPRKTTPRNLIVIRVDDKSIRANGGIAAGMSGSPVYIGEKLIGAIGYGWAFSDNNMGLVTPIEEMTRSMEWPVNIPKFGIPVPAPEEPVSADKAEHAASRDMTLSSDKTVVSADVSNDIEAVSGEVPEKKMMPLTVDGISERFAKGLEKKLGVKVMPLGAANAAGSPANLKWEPKPGAAMGAALAWGDFTAGAIGTLTAVSKDGRFIAFAHPMFNKGSVSYALMDANIIKVIPSLESSFKLGSLNKITGLVTQDRPEAIGGELGKLAAASSYSLKFKNIDTGKTDVKRFQTVADPFTGPGIGATGILGLIDEQWAQRGEGTAMVSYSVSGGNLNPAWTRSNIFYSDKDIVKSLQKEIEGMGKVISLNPFRAISPYGVNVSVEMTKTPRVVFIDKVEIADKKDSYKPGEKVKVDVRFRPWRKAPVVKRFELTVPENAVAFCEITARAGGVEEPSQEPILSGIRAVNTFSELLKELNVKETNNQIIVEISGPEKGDKKKKPKTEASKNKDGEGAGLKGSENKDKKPDSGRDAKDVKNDKKDKKPSLTPEDMLEDRFVSEIREERIKEGAMVIADTNYYVEGVLRRFIKVKAKVSNGEMTDDEASAMMAEKENAAESDGEEISDSDEELPPDDGSDDGGDEDQNSFSLLMRKPADR